MTDTKVIRDKKYGKLVVIDETEIFVNVYREGQDESASFWYPKSKIVQVPEKQKSQRALRQEARRARLIDESDAEWQTHLRQHAVAYVTCHEHHIPKVMLILDREVGISINGDEPFIYKRNPASTQSQYAPSFGIRFRGPLPAGFPSDVKLHQVGNSFTAGCDSRFVLDLLALGVVSLGHQVTI